MRRLVGLLFFLAACQPVPRPLSDIDRRTIAEPSDSAGIVVLPVAGAPAPSATAVAEAMAEALRNIDIPATTLGGNKGSYRLAGTAHADEARGGRVIVALDWELRAADGRILGHVPARAEEPGSDWTAGSPRLAQEIAAPSARGIANLVSDEPPAAARAADLAIGVRPVTGAPGDGGPALTRAMDAALRRAHVALAEKDAVADFVLAGTVTLSPAQQGRQRVAVHWALLGADGHQIGKVDQENAVAAGSLDGAWGDVAYAVADAAAPGVVALLNRARSEAGS